MQLVESHWTLHCFALLQKFLAHDSVVSECCKAFGLNPITETINKIKLNFLMRFLPQITKFAKLSTIIRTVNFVLFCTQHSLVVSQTGLHLLLSKSQFVFVFVSVCLIS